MKKQKGLRVASVDRFAVTSDGFLLSEDEACKSGFAIGSYSECVQLACVEIVKGLSKRKIAEIVGGISSAHSKPKKKVRKDIDEMLKQLGLD